ncbi:MAG TPA: carboxymuconolactone decarboxylase family protein [Azospirillaceae bacterium]|nr:carboxymuconolactone decarboxylase family protein [Azospirillaceae bacterium]
MPRLAPAEAPFDPSVAATIDRVRPPGAPPLALFRTLAHNPRVLSRFFAAALLDPGSVTVRQRELMILRTCARAGSEYEWGVHVALYAKAAGLDEAMVAATCAPAAVLPPMDPADRLVLDLADALHDTATVDDALWARLAAALEPAQIVELVTLAGLYRMVSGLTNALGVENEAYGARFPA